MRLSSGEYAKYKARTRFILLSTCALGDSQRFRARILVFELRYVASKTLFDSFGLRSTILVVTGEDPTQRGRAMAFIRRAAIPIAPITRIRDWVREGKRGRIT